MKELFNVTPNTTGRGFRMQLSTGTIDVPDKPGGYIISSGCGSGKTESIKSLIWQKYNEGILYCVDTRDELEKMYSWILTELTDKDMGESEKLSANEVMIISSDKERAYFLDQYRDNPEILMQRKVILITHLRFWTDLINYFLIYKPSEEVRHFNGDFKELMKRKDLRHYILFDETPTFIRPFVEFDRTVLGVFGTKNCNGDIVCRSSDDIRDFYNRFLKGTKSDLFNQTYKINRIKREVVLELIPQYYDSWMLSGDEKVGITFYPADLCPEGMNISTHVLVFEGAGDLLHRNSRNFTLLDVGQKYNSTTEFKKIEFGISRKNELDKKKFSKFINKIAGVISKKTLVVCWKSINGDDTEPGKSEYADRLKYELLKKGVNPEMFHVTYYGSADNKSTNSYRDIEQIILCGNWSLPNTETAKIRRAYGTTTDSLNHKEWFFCQLITRIGIRKHQKGTYTVYYTDDFSANFIERMKAYLNESRVLTHRKKLEDWREKLEGMRIRNNLKEDIIRLAQFDERIRNAIVMEQEYTKKVSFDYLEMIGIKRSARERRRYNKLTKELAKIRINLEIT